MDEPKNHMAPRNEGENAEKSSSVSIVAEIAPSFTYASFQNAIPVLRSIRIDNPTLDNLEGCVLELSANPAFFRPKTWTIDRLMAGDLLTLTDRKVDLDAGYLAGLNEAERGTVALQLKSRDELLAELVVPVRLLARDEWGGTDDMAQLLPAFVMPNDPAISKILRAAADSLASHGHPSGMDGYQSGDPRRAYMILAGIYAAVADQSLHYAEPPASFESRGQKIRRPHAIARDGLATCLDTSLLFAGALEAAGLNAVVIMFKGHSAAGVWLTKRTLPRSIETDAAEIRKAIAAHELVVFETTGVTHRPPMTLDNARRLTEQRLEESAASSYLTAIDVHRCRSGGITPLASHQPPSDTAAEADAASTNMSLPLPPEFGAMPAEIVEEKPTTATGRIDRWQRKLLDLTLRNRLLNFTESKKAVPFLCPDIADLEDRLTNRTAIRLISLPEQNPLGERDAALFRETRGHDLNRTFAAEALQRDELASPLAQRELEARLIALHRQVKNDLAEGGTNTLYMAIGFLRWKKKPDDERSYRAPLLLLPVKLDRRSASSRFNLLYHEDEPRFNATLFQFLERDFSLPLPQFQGPLPLDNDGIDVPGLLDNMRRAVRDVPGFEVVDETALSTFSFAKYLMWKDLTERTDALRQNRVVKHLIDTPDRAFDTQGSSFPNEAEIDRNYSPVDIVTPLPADSSQIAASLAAAEGMDFVVVGPPGTGKSQTIANMIANCLASGKTVLFVAEKTAALDVVYRRLREHGLGDHCLELHSNKADRRHFLGQLKNAWDNGARTAPSEWLTINGKLKIRRDELNAYVEALHREAANGLTAFKAMGIALFGKDRHAPALSWPSQNSHDRDGYAKLEDLAKRLGLTFAAVERTPALEAVNVNEWSSAWQERLMDAARSLQGATLHLRAVLERFRIELGLPPLDDTNLDGLKRFSAFARSILSSAGKEFTIIFDREFDQLHDSLAALDGAISTFRTNEAALSAPYRRDELVRVPVDDLEQQWRLANAAFWPKSWFGIRKARKLLKSYAEGGKPDPAVDLPIIRRLQASHASVSENMLASRSTRFAGLDTDTAQFSAFLATATDLRTSLLQLARLTGEVQGIATRVAAVLAQPGKTSLHELSDRYLAALRGFVVAIKAFGETAERPPINPESPTLLNDAAEVARGIEQARHLLRDWSSWCAVRDLAQAQGLAPLVADLVSDAVAPEQSLDAFHLAYARWWLPLAIDAEPVLRNFRRFQHENAIEEFRALDDMARQHATARVTSAIAHDLPPSTEVPRRSELGLLRHQMELQRPSRAIREMIAGMPQSFAKLAPCVLMSPLSIAQYLPPDQALFDVVIFDEASQITTWDAVGAIARGRQTIIVGDPKQLPPTNFFGRNEPEDDDTEVYEQDLESILDEVKASGLPIHDLRWHYRSRHESLIAFSNWHYYQNRLITFPSPVTDDNAVSLRHVTEGVYDRGKSRTNRPEAQAVAREVASCLQQWLKLPEAKRPTIGVITFNSQQQGLIQDLLDDERRANPEFEWFFSEDRIEPVIVKNLENVQGDERDIVLFSITFCKDAAGKLTMDFGAINKNGGERRLNVAVTRAREELIVFSGIKADQIDPARTKAKGAHHLKAFLDYAERGSIALPAQDIGSQGSLESPFEEAVAAELERKGWQVVPQVGVSGFRIDIGVKNPDRAGAYLAGIECDGAIYHSAPIARDRDKVREQVLRGLGWEILRVWSTDWWFDQSGSMDRLHKALEELLTVSRNEANDHGAEDDGQIATKTDSGSSALSSAP
jgi:very-short-patch-repair endonuclease